MRTHRHDFTSTLRGRKIRDRHSDVMLCSFEGVPDNLSPEDIFNTIVATDLSPSKKYVEWILRGLKNKDINFADIGPDNIVSTTLMLYDMNKTRILGDNINNHIFYHKNHHTVEQVLNSLDPKPILMESAIKTYKETKDINSEDVMSEPQTTSRTIVSKSGKTLTMPCL